MSTTTEAEQAGGALFLGILQGLTEFLPVSSSGHLVLFQQFIDVGGDDVLFDLVLHVGSLVPVLWFYRVYVQQLAVGPFSEPEPFFSRPAVRLWACLVAASIPTAVIGLAFKDYFEAMFATPAMLSVTFLITAGLLLASRRFEAVAGGRPLTIPLAVALGVAQGFAITPGISRSGTTIAVALMLGLPREEAARFSFLMAVPAICGALLLKLRDVDAAQPLLLLPLLVGFVASAVSGWFALRWLVAIVKRGGLDKFAYYLVFIAVVAGAIALYR